MKISIQSLVEGAGDRHCSGHRRIPSVHYRCRGAGEWGVKHRDGQHGRGSVGIARDICMGEVQGRAPPEFDFGNSPFERCHSAIDELQGWHKSGRDHDRATFGLYWARRLALQSKSFSGNATQVVRALHTALCTSSVSVSTRSASAFAVSVS
jgi:hypothetical protein